MEERSEIDKLFSNYLRGLYIKPSEEELAWIKTEIPLIVEKSWCAIISDMRKIKGLLSYYLILNKCPEYEYYTTVDLVEQRFDDENSIRNLVAYDGILILRHSATFIRNKLMLETVMYIIAERAYKNRATIMISDAILDKGEHVYYDHNKIVKYITCDISERTLTASRNVPLAHKIGSKPSPLLRAHASRPLANINKGEDKFSAEQQLQDRSKSIEENAKNAI